MYANIRISDVSKPKTVRGDDVGRLDAYASAPLNGQKPDVDAALVQWMINGKKHRKLYRDIR